mmetsp:Transcript_30722/g.91070  ORF Transcript_30722/g.91070 Transcript_30722/m.91070 type:complete len:304 (+) Transcript_30722:1553-2464(+)
MLRKTAASGDSTALGRLWAVSRARLAATPSCRKPLSAVGTSTLAPFDCTEAAPRSIAAQPAMPAGSTSSRMRACAPDASAPAPAPPFVLSNNSGDTPCFSAAWIVAKNECVGGGGECDSCAADRGEDATVGQQIGGRCDICAADGGVGCDSCAVDKGARQHVGGKLHSPTSPLQGAGKVLRKARWGVRFTSAHNPRHRTLLSHTPTPCQYLHELQFPLERVAERRLRGTGRRERQQAQSVQHDQRNVTLLERAEGLGTLLVAQCAFLVDPRGVKQLCRAKVVQLHQSDPAPRLARGSRQVSGA